MVETALLVALIGIGGTLAATLVGSYVNLKTTKIQQKKENHRIVAEYYLDKKLENLIELYSINKTVSEGFGTFVYLSRKDGDVVITEEKYDRYSDKINKFDEISKKTKIYLTDSQASILTKCSIIYKTILNSIHEEKDGYKIDWDEVEEKEYIKQHDAKLDTFGLHARMVTEMIYNELNIPLNELYDRSDKSKLTQEMKDYVRGPRFTTYDKSDYEEMINEVKRNL